MSWKNTKKRWLVAGSLALLLGSAPGFAQQECEQIRKNCLDHCHYAPQHQWSSGFKCKRECTKQVDACRRGIRGYPPAYSYGSRSGYGYGGAPAQRGGVRRLPGRHIRPARGLIRLWCRAGAAAWVWWLSGCCAWPAATASAERLRCPCRGRRTAFRRSLVRRIR